MITSKSFFPRESQLDLAVVRCFSDMFRLKETTTLFLFPSRCISVQITFPPPPLPEYNWCCCWVGEENVPRPESDLLLIYVFYVLKG